MMTLNGDVGESYGIWSLGRDEQLIPLLDMANIACGFHASDPETMSNTVRLCRQHNVSIGAHPGYDDKVGFGRRSIDMSESAITASIMYQVGALQGICQLHSCQVDYIKPHGAMYHDMMASTSVMTAIFKAAAILNLPVMLLANKQPEPSIHLANEMGVTVIFEAFADRRYTEGGELAPRTQTDAVFHKEDDILTQAHSILENSVVFSATGRALKLSASTLCVHGDNAASIEVATSIRTLINQYGLTNEP